MSVPYEYIDKAAPRSVNGLPIFFSMRMLSRADQKRLSEKVQRLREAERTALQTEGGK